MPRRTVGARLERPWLQHLQGTRAKADGGICDRCDGPILKDQRIVKSGEHWVHAGCHAEVHE